MPFKFAVIVGMKNEKILLPGLEVGVSGGVTAKALELSRSYLKQDFDGLVSFGLAGGLDPTYPAGTLIIATRVITDHNDISCDPVWSDRLAENCREAIRGEIFGSESVISSAQAKSDLYKRFGALSVDMESGAVAQAAEEANKPFIVLRVIADPADRALPPSALVGLDAEGGLRPMAVLLNLLRQPGDIPALRRLSRDYRQALPVLKGAAYLLTPRPSRPS